MNELVGRAAEAHGVSRDPTPSLVTGVTQALARAIGHETVSTSRDRPTCGEAFDDLHAELRASFPRVHAELEVERVGGWSLLYRWRGRDPDRAPIVLAAHQDVVPADPHDDPAWEHPPFSGDVADGHVWGRGALDDKGSLISILAAVEHLLEDGFEPRRSIVVGLGHDEEIGGEAGARVIAERLEADGIGALMVLDEGGAIASDVLPGVGPVALVGVAEKGNVSVELSVETTGGHASMPPRQSAVGVMAAAVKALERDRPRARVIGPTRETLRAIASALPWPRSAALRVASQVDPLVVLAFARRPALDAAVRTTTAVTVIAGGDKSNVLPARVCAVVNFRILPGETVEGILEHVRTTVGDERVRIGISNETAARDPSPTSPTSGPAFRLIESTITATFPDVVVAPYLVLGGTDARHYARITDAVYQFLPLRLEAGDRGRLHGIDERVSIGALSDMVRFYRDLIQRAQHVA